MNYDMKRLYRLVLQQGWIPRIDESVYDDVLLKVAFMDDMPDFTGLRVYPYPAIIYE